MSRNLAKSSLNRSRTPRTVLLRMAADADRAQRLKEIKDARPDLTWAQVAEGVGVTERSVAEWAKSGSIGYPNAKRLAEFLEVDLDWLWKGPARQSPDLMSALVAPDLVLNRLDTMEELLRENREMMRDLLAFATERALGDVPPPDETPAAEPGQDAGASGQTP